MKKTKEELETECKQLQKIDRWYGILAISGTVIILFGFFALDNLTVTFIGVIPTLIALIFLAPRCRCPYCGGYLKMKYGLPSHCPCCGQQLSGKKPEEQSDTNL